MNTWAFGDVHGAAKALKQVLEKAPIKEGDKIISLGDLCDGWSETPEVIDICIELSKKYECYFIRGNHDVWCWNWFVYGDTPDIWIHQGGKATRDAYVRTGKMVDKTHKDFWDKQIDYYIDSENRLFVHGGFELYEGFKDTKQIKINFRNANMYHWSRDLAMIYDPSPEQLQKLYEFKEIFIGHTNHTHRPTDFNQYNVWNLDSGAGGRFGLLTIMNVDTKEYWQSDRSGLLYHDEIGR